MFRGKILNYAHLVMADQHIINDKATITSSWPAIPGEGLYQYHNWRSNAFYYLAEDTGELSSLPESLSSLFLPLFFAR